MPSFSRSRAEKAGMRRGSRIRSTRAAGAGGFYTFRHTLDKHSDVYEHRWGRHWLARVRELVEVEQRSSALRTMSRSSQFQQLRYQSCREDMLVDVCERRISESEHKTIINVGMWHAQKKPFMGWWMSWLATP